MCSAGMLQLDLATVNCVKTTQFYMSALMGELTFSLEFKLEFTQMWGCRHLNVSTLIQRDKTKWHVKN